MMESLRAAQLEKRLQDCKSFRLIDVREESEWALCRLPKAELIPLSTFTVTALECLAQDEEILLYCHHGVRSEKAGNFLIAQGYANVKHLEGGIDCWSLEVDSTVIRY